MRHLRSSVCLVVLHILMGGALTPGCSGPGSSPDGADAPFPADAAAGPATVGSQPGTAAPSTDPESPRMGDPLPPAPPAPPPGFGTGVYTDGGFTPDATAAPQDAALNPDAPATRDTAGDRRTDAAAFMLCRPLVACEVEGATCSSLSCIGAVRAMYRCTCARGRYTCTSQACTDGGTP